MGPDFMDMIEKQFKNKESGFKSQQANQNEPEPSFDVNAKLDLRLTRNLISNCNFDLATVKTLFDSKACSQFINDQFIDDYFKSCKKTKAADKTVHLKLMNFDMNFNKFYLVEELFMEFFLVKIKFVE